MTWREVMNRRMDARRDGRLDVRVARHHVRDVVGTLSLGIDLEDLELAVTELVTNAALHTASGWVDGGVGIVVRAMNGRVRVEVTDDGGADTHPLVPDAVDDEGWLGESGRGLAMVGALADKAGAYPVPGRNGPRWVVWFELPGTVSESADHEERVLLRLALNVASAAFTEAMGTYGMLPGTVKTIHTMAEGNLDRVLG
ncbi:ATP-binding protein [Actinomadura harenae]|uniref:ATP-binding protein n=1 Tax=Actinomadura harenae TaxID=2483351 RepID=A0A3M2LS27_9ACTN|nr:ATP-binding protein [Actinomadura harenae]RMI40197.1 ATP-binding protein [Actinomadura harenae]